MVEAQLSRESLALQLNILHSGFLGCVLFEAANGSTITGHLPRLTNSFSQSTWAQPSFWQQDLRELFANAELAVFDTPIHEISDAALYGLSNAKVKSLYCRIDDHWRVVPIHNRALLLALLAKRRLGRLVSKAADTLELSLRKVLLKRWGVDLHDAGVDAFKHEEGFCYRAAVPALSRWSDTEGLEREGVLLFEEKTLLRLHQSHADIRELGAGRATLWRGEFYFSTTDGTDPNINGRRYRFLIVDGKKRTLRSLFPFYSKLNAPFIPRPAKASELERLSGHVDLPIGAKGFEKLAKLIEDENNQGKITLRATDEITMLISGLPPGGAERQLCYLAKDLTTRGFRVRVITWPQDSAENLHYLPYLRDAGISVDFLTEPHPDFKLSNLPVEELDRLTSIIDLPGDLGRDAWVLYTHLQVHKPRLLHCWLDHPNATGAVAGILAQVPKIVLSTRNVNPTHFHYIMQDWLKPCYAIASRSNRVTIMGNSQIGTNSYADWLGLKKDSLPVVYNGLDLETIRPVAAEEVAALKNSLGIPQEAPVIAGVFRLNYEKRPSYFLRIIAALKREFPNLHAIIAGVGPLEKQLRDEISVRGLSNSVHLLGRRNDIPVVISAASLCLLTSSEEGLPNVLMEAQLLGRAIVCSDVGGIPEVVRNGETAFVCELSEPATFVDRCRELLTNDALRQQFGDRGRSWVVEQFSLPTMTNRTLAAYGWLSTIDARRSNTTQIDRTVNG